MATRSPTRPPAESARPRAVDESMSLLRDVTTLSLDPGYARAKEAERAGGGRPGRTAGALTALVSVFLGCVTVWAVRELRVPAPLAAERRTALLERVEQETESVQRLQGSAEDLRADINRLQLAAVDAPVSDQLDELTGAAAQTPVEGPGLRVTMRDAESVGDEGGVGADPRDDSALEEGRVLDRDLQVVVNALWAAGAEAVAINGERLSSLSAIRGAGEAVLVDFQPLVPPYRVEAIGDAARMQAGFAANGGGDYVRQLRDVLGIGVSMAAADKITLPAVGEPSLRWARSSTGQTGTSTTSVSSDGSAQEDTP